MVGFGGRPCGDHKSYLGYSDYKDSLMVVFKSMSPPISNNSFQGCYHKAGYRGDFTLIKLD